MADSAPTSAAPAKPLVWLFAFMLGLTLWLTTRGWQNSLLDRHEFRQLQTATSAYWIKAAGYKLDYELPLFGPPWSIPMEFPVYQWLVATASNTLGTPLEGTARALSLFFFLATLPAVYGLAGFFGLAPSRRLLVAAAVLASPTYLFYARTFMIETTALGFSTWFLCALGRAVRDDSLRWGAAAAVLAVLAALAKPTTFLVFLLPGAVLFLRFWLPGWRRGEPGGAGDWRRAALAAAPVLVALGVAWWWVKHADRVKDSNPFAGFLTSRELVKWNWGTWEQRLSGEFWSAAWSNISNFVLGETPLAVLLLGAALAAAPLRRVAAWCAGFFLGGLLLFSNLFHHHDYYYCANALLLLFGAGVLLAGVWDNLRLPLAARALVLFLFFGGQLLLYHRGYAEYLRHPPPPPPGLAEVIRAGVPPDGVILIYGWDWSAQMPYYAQRRAISVPGGREEEFAVLDTILKKLPPRKIAGMLIRHAPRRINRLEFVRVRTARFNLSPAPFATSVEGELYLPEDAIAATAAKLKDRGFAGVTLNTQPPADPNAGKLKPDDLTGLDFAMTSPRPTAARSMFGLNLGDVGLGRKVILAHSDSEISFTPPPGATHITAEVGINPAAYAPDATAVTDGVSVTIFELRADGLRRVLYQRDLDPVKAPGDRGPQQISLDGAGPFTGPVVFKISPGPANNLVNDWAYWGRIEIR
ncbi:MAG: glycosyltransferase family 39 protein [Opitutae bacterium]|nr:glycosyltransferase family 39 protein [Opitutae bacterium]